MARYHASLIGGQNVVFKPYVDVSESGVVLKIPGFLSGEKHSVGYDNISDIKVSGSIISKTVEIHTKGAGIIRAEGFSSGDAKSMQREIEHYQQLKQKSASSSTSRLQRENNEYTPRQVIAEHFTRPEYIPQIHFSHDKEALFNTLNTLKLYAKQELQSRDPYVKSLLAQADKLEEGISIAKMQGYHQQEFYGKQLDEIETLLITIRYKAHRKKSSAKAWSFLRWSLVALICFYLYKGCVAVYHSAKEWAAEQEDKKQMPESESTKSKKTKSKKYE